MPAAAAMAMPPVATVLSMMKKRYAPIEITHQFCFIKSQAS
jgi:hypothetical protein